MTRPDARSSRYGHTVDGLMLCGGGHSSDNCETFSQGNKYHQDTWCVN